MPRSFRPLLLAALAVAVVAGVTSTTATAVAAVTVTPTSADVVGDLTGDGIADRTTLGTDGAALPACSARVRPGRSGGGFDTGTFRPLPLRASMLLTCPDLATVVTGPSAGQARLAVTWSSVPPLGGRSVQFFRWAAATRTWTYDGGTNGQFQPSTIAARDLDGDRWGDLVETTDQGSGVTVFVGRASAYTQLWSSSPSTADVLSFADFDHSAGTDLLDAHAFFGSSNVGVTVVDGATGTAVDLVTDTDPFPASYLPKAVDVDHDGWLDVRVQVTDADGNRQPDLVFRNRANGRLAFVRR